MLLLLALSTEKHCTFFFHIFLKVMYTVFFCTFYRIKLLHISLEFHADVALWCENSPLPEGSLILQMFGLSHAVKSANPKHTAHGKTDYRLQPNKHSPQTKVFFQSASVQVLLEACQSWELKNNYKKGTFNMIYNANNSYEIQINRKFTLLRLVQSAKLQPSDEMLGWLANESVVSCVL